MEAEAVRSHSTNPGSTEAVACDTSYKGVKVFTNRVKMQNNNATIELSVMILKSGSFEKILLIDKIIDCRDISSDR